MNVPRWACKMGRKTRAAAACCGALALLAGCNDAANDATDATGADSGVVATQEDDAGGDAALVTTELDVAAGDVTIHMWVTGGDANSPALVLVNGGPGLTHHSLAPLASLATATRRVVLYDQRGMGRSTAPATPAYDGAAYVADLEAVRVQLGVERLHLLGHSNGGLISQEYLVAHPDRVASLVLVGSLPPDSDDLYAGLGRFQQHVTDLQATGLLPAELPPEGCEQLSAITPAYFADPTMPIPQALQDAECNWDILVQTETETWAPYDWRSTLTGLDLPVLVVFGAEDAFGTEWATVVAETFGTAPPTLLPGIAHFPWFEQPETFYEIVRPFLTAHVGP